MFAGCNSRGCIHESSTGDTCATVLGVLAAVIYVDIKIAIAEGTSK